jgi:NADP-dependent 3-hydroxy acid dehydrogenase YdfG
VVAAARRTDRLADLVKEIEHVGGSATAVPLDVTDDTQVAALAARRSAMHALVNNAGVARGGDHVEDADIGDRPWMYDVNVLGTVRTADDIADCVAWCVTLPHHVNIDRLVIRPIAQAAQHKVVREK